MTSHQRNQTTTQRPFMSAWDSKAAWPVWSSRRPVLASAFYTDFCCVSCGIGQR